MASSPRTAICLGDRSTRQAVIVDPGEEPRLFLAELDTRGWSLQAIWLTHAHLDHIMGVRAVKEATGVPIHLHPADRSLYDALPQQGEWMGLPLQVPPPPDADLAGRAGASPRRPRVRGAPHPWTLARKR